MGEKKGEEAVAERGGRKAGGNFRQWFFAALFLGLVWELVARPCMGIIFPDAPLPQSFLQELLSLCMGMIGI